MLWFKKKKASPQEAMPTPSAETADSLAEKKAARERDGALHDVFRYIVSFARIEDLGPMKEVSDEVLEYSLCHLEWRGDRHVCELIMRELADRPSQKKGFKDRMEEVYATYPEFKRNA